MNTSFPYKNALVTGASSGLGAGICRLLAREGVVVHGVSREASRIMTPGVIPVVLNLCDLGAVRKFAQEELPQMQIDLLINCAGIGIFSDFSETPESDLLDQLQVMLEAPTVLDRAALPGMLERGCGCIVNVSSLAARFPLPCMAAYNMTKAGLSALSASLVEELRPTPIRVIDFQPGDFNSGFFQSTRRLGGNDAAWKAAENHLAGAPNADEIAKALANAIRKGKSGTVTAGSFFQTQLAPLGQRVLPGALFRHLQRMYTE